MLAGMIGQFIASPMDLVKVQMQMEGRRVLEGKPPRSVKYNSAYTHTSHLKIQVCFPP